LCLATFELEVVCSSGTSAEFRSHLPGILLLTFVLLLPAFCHLLHSAHFRLPTLLLLLLLSPFMIGAAAAAAAAEAHVLCGRVQKLAIPGGHERVVQL
jgi:hypothetical protein